MKIEYLRTASKSYLILKEAELSFETYETQMVLKNRISCLLETQIIISDGVPEYWFEVSGLQSLKSMFETAILSENDVRLLIHNICTMKLLLDDYMLTDVHISYAPELVYQEKSTGIFRFCYLPGCQKPLFGLLDLMEEALQHIDHTDPIAVKMAYALYELCALGNPSIQDLMKCLSADEKECSAQRADPEPAEAPYADRYLGETWGETVQEPISEGKIKTEIKKQKSKFFEGLKNRIEYRRSGMEQPYLMEADPGYGYNAKNECDSEATISLPDSLLENVFALQYRGSGMEEDFSLEKTPFVIGKDGDRSDGILKADTVSRIHARIMYIDQAYYIEDYNSANGTFLNGDLMPPYTLMPFGKNDRIIFGTEEYVVVDRRIMKC